MVRLVRLQRRQRRLRPSGTAALAFATTNTAVAAAMLAWMFFDWIRREEALGAGGVHRRGRRPGRHHPGRRLRHRPAEHRHRPAASVVSNLAVHLKTKSTLDDTLDVFPCHGVGGMTGMILTGLFAKDVGLGYGSATTFLYHLLGLVIVAAFAFVGSLVLYKVTDLIIPLRVTDEQEQLGPGPQPARRNGSQHRPVQ